jgi:ribonuclease BN (tRNA processing enzyme)
MPETLGQHDPSLRDIYFIEGIGLCSNIFVFVEGDSISLVDTGSGIAPNTVISQLEQLDLKIEEVARVVLTHGHIDHIGGLPGICEHSSPEIFVHENDADDVISLGIKSIHKLRDGDEIRLGRRDLRVLHTPGHARKRVLARQRTHTHRGHCLPRRILRKNGPRVRRLEKTHRFTRQAIPSGSPSHAPRTWRTAAIGSIFASQTGSENRRTC